VAGAGYTHSGGALARAFPPTSVDFKVIELKGNGRRTEYVGRRRPEYGDLVTVRLVRNSHQIWREEQLFVVAAKPKGLLVKLPCAPQGLDLRVEQEQPNTLVEVEVTHSDKLAHQKWRTLRDRLERESDLPHFNAAMSDHDTRPDRFSRRAQVLADLAHEIKRETSALDERPWSSSGAMSTAQIKADYTRMLRELDGITAMWLDLVRRVQENVEKAYLVNVPRDPSDVRPTALGNVLAAAVGYPWRAYGIDTATILPMLLTVLSGEQAAVQRFRAADASLDLLLLLSFWGCVWSALCLVVGLPAHMLMSTTGHRVVPLMAMLGLAFALLMREAAVAQAYAYGDAGKVLFDLHRHELLARLGLVVEDELTPEEESVNYWQPLYRLFAFGEHYKGMRLKTTVLAPTGGSGNADQHTPSPRSEVVATTVDALRNGVSR
jgi:hypothetical protein